MTKEAIWELSIAALAALNLTSAIVNAVIFANLIRNRQKIEIKARQEMALKILDLVAEAKKEREEENAGS